MHAHEGGRGGAIVHMSGGVALLYILHRENKIFVVTVLLKHLTYPVGLTLPITPCLCNAATGTLIMCFLKWVSWFIKPETRVKYWLLHMAPIFSPTKFSPSWGIFVTFPWLFRFSIILPEHACYNLLVETFLWAGIISEKMGYRSLWSSRHTRFSSVRIP